MPDTLVAVETNNATTPRLFDRSAVWITAIFVVSRIAYWLAGVRFDTHPLYQYFQIVDPVLLKTRLLESLLHLHTQAPGFNMLIGLVLKLFPNHFGPAMHTVYMAFGLGIALLVHALMRALGVNAKVALIVAIWLTVSPGVVLHENFLLYEYPILFLLVLDAWFLYKSFRERSSSAIWGFLLTFAALGWMRGNFHPVLLAGFGLVLYWLLKDRRRTVALAGTAAMALLLVVYVKNLVLFGKFTATTWTGMNIYTIATHQLTPEEKQQLHAEGVLDDAGLILPFDLKPFIEGGFVTLPPRTGIPVLDQQYDSTGRVNFNHQAFFQVHEINMRTGRAVLKRMPKAWVRSTVKAWFAYFLPAGDFTFFERTRPHIAKWDRLWNLVFFGQWKEASNRKDLRKMEAQGSSLGLVLYTGTYLLVGMPLLWLFTLYWLYKSWRQKMDLAPWMLAAFALFHILFSAAIFNTLSSFETNRYRVPVDGFYTVLLGLALQSMWMWWQKRRVVSP
jgi:hypothetical protein